MIRRAKLEDAKAIHEAHMLSIQTICSKQHSPEEIRAWGERPFKEDQRIEAIQNQHVWVVELNEKIEGYGHLRIYEKDGSKLAHIMGLYFTPKAIGMKFGRVLFEMMLNVAKENCATKLSLDSTLTAHGFYKKMGFKEDGGLITVEIAGTPIRCIPMSMKLA
ncbi:MAG: GNAT family N-acetyltransferase [Pseudobdellovibrionaceae bacterium]